MQLTIPAPSYPADLAGVFFAKPSFWQTRARIHYLITEYLSFSKLNECLTELPHQFIEPNTRPWQSIDWKSIHQKQIIGINPDIFLAIVRGAIDTEAPIREYTQTSRQYLAPIHPHMARYVGGTIDAEGTLLEPGLWEKEERQHTPALLKLYHQLTGRKAEIHARTVREYHPTDNPVTDLYRHGLHRIATEYGAVCLYLWLMSHTTGPLQAVLAELLQDEINHMTKFWGFGLWLFPESHGQRTRHIIQQVTQSHPATSAHRLRHTINRMMGVLHWHNWQRHHQAELALTFCTVLYHLHQWSNQLSSSHLCEVLGQTPVQER